MDKLTQRLLQIGAVLFILWFGWSFARETIVTFFQLQNRTLQAEAQLSECLKKK